MGWETFGGLLCFWRPWVWLFIMPKCPSKVPMRPQTSYFTTALSCACPSFMTTLKPMVLPGCFFVGLEAVFLTFVTCRPMTSSFVALRFSCLEIGVVDFDFLVAETRWDLWHVRHRRRYIHGDNGGFVVRHGAGHDGSRPFQWPPFPCATFDRKR